MNQQPNILSCEGCPERSLGKERLCTPVVYAIIRALPQNGVDTSCDTRSSHEIATQFVSLPAVMQVAKAACANARPATPDENLDTLLKQTPFYGAYY